MQDPFKEYLIHSYYEETPKTSQDRTEEADKVSVRIAQILSEKSEIIILRRKSGF